MAENQAFRPWSGEMAVTQDRSPDARDPKLVCVVDDEAAILASYCALLESEGFKPVPYTSGAMLLADDKYQRCGCVVLDLHMPPPDGIETLRRMRASGVLSPVIMITGEGDIPTAVEAMKLGAFDFAEKPINDDALIKLVGDASRAPASEPRHDRHLSDRESSSLNSLTERERQVLDYLIEGATNKEIARELGISHRTVELHRANIMEKTGAKSLSRLVLMAVGHL